jgi:hypothetical protein
MAVLGDLHQCLTEWDLIDHQLQLLARIDSAVDHNRQPLGRTETGQGITQPYARPVDGDGRLELPT